MADELMVVSLWKHEMNRIIRDRIARTSDLNWFDEIMEKTQTLVGSLCSLDCFYENEK